MFYSLLLISFTFLSFAQDDLPQVSPPPSTTIDPTTVLQRTKPNDAADYTALSRKQRNLRSTVAIRRAYSEYGGLSENDARRAILLESKHGNVDAVKILLENGVDPNSRSNMGETPLLNTVTFSWGGKELMETLI